ncbi:MAG: hypothetical protein Q8K75_08140 [Chlamydiales bacterium]|nr:hypothetical protein [Chlamydiales bacterium]
MQAISGLMGISPQTSSPKTTTNVQPTTWPLVGSLFAACSMVNTGEKSSSIWDVIKFDARVIDLMPDLSTITDSANVISQEMFGILPIAMRVAFASVAVLNIFLLPIFLQELKDMIPRVLMKLHTGLAIDKTVNIAYMAALSAAMVALTALGVKEFCEIFQVTPVLVHRLLDYIMPWISYALRVVMIVQLMDIVTGMRFQREIDHTLSPEQRRPSWMSADQSFIASVAYLPLSPVLYVFQGALDSYRSASDSIAVMRDRRRYLRRCNGFSQGFNKTVAQLDRGLRNWWWNPVSAYVAMRQTNRLAHELRDRSVSYIRNQVFGLGANIFAGFSMIATNVVAVAVLSVGSAGFYISQTVHRWNMVTPVTYSDKKGVNSELSSVFRGLSFGANKLATKLAG